MTTSVGAYTGSYAAANSQRRDGLLVGLVLTVEATNMNTPAAPQSSASGVSTSPNGLDVLLQGSWEQHQQKACTRRGMDCSAVFMDDDCSFWKPRCNPNFRV